MQLDVVLDQRETAEGTGGGLHLMAEWHECECPRLLLGSPHHIRDTCVAAVERAGLTMVGDRFHALPDGGITAMVLLAESHLAIRTWPSVAAAALDVFVCNYRTDNRRKAQSLFHILRAAYRPGRERLLQIGRSGATP